MVLAFLSPLLLGAVLNLDRQMCGPFMVSRPLVAGLVIGFAVGDVPKGVWLGLSVELLWLGAVPLGGSLSPNAGLATTAALSAWAGQALIKDGASFPPPGVVAGLTEAVLVLLFITVPLWAKIFNLIDLAARRASPAQVEAARADLLAGRDPHFFRRNLTGVGLNFLGALLALLIAVPVNMFFLKLAAYLSPPALLSGLSAAFAFIPFLGLFGMAVFMEAKTVTHYLGGILAGLLVLSAI